ncbi:MAG: hypothetical protein LBJ63_04825 [Prevotellaceae bacterium]|jgi:hypothetical protein|nr:hypothetical protein [Prevotellaceae bacterium]
MIRRRNILSETNNCQLKCPAWNKTLVEKETNSRHSDESQNPLNDEIAGRTRNDDRMYFRPDKFTKLRKKPFFVIARRNAEAIRKSLLINRIAFCFVPRSSQ